MTTENSSDARRSATRRGTLAGSAVAVAALAWLVPGAAYAAFTVTTSPSSAAPGKYVAVKLVEAGDADQVDVELDGQKLVALRADAGSLTTCLQIPHGTAAGPHTLRFVGDDDTVATATITVDPNAAGATSDCAPAGSTTSPSPTSSSTTTTSTSSPTSSSSSSTTATSAGTTSSGGTSGGSLAKTGSQIVTMAAAGVLLAGGGVLLRLLRRRSSP